MSLTAPAAAYLCHKDPPGTRVLFLHGTIANYSANGTRVTVAFRGASGCRSFVWNAASGMVRERRVGCVAPPEVAATNVRTISGGSARPAMLVAHGHRWPLPAEPATLAVANEFAIFSARGGGGLYALRLSDGRFGLLGPNRPHDTPRVNSAGVFYQDDEFKRDRRNGIVRLKFVPASGIATIIDRAQKPLITNGRIASIGMDGPRVAIAAMDPSRNCDRVLYWNVAWRPVQRISAPNGPTCVLRKHTAIRRVAIGGFRAAWLRASGSSQAIVAGSPKCQEWVIRRLRAGSGGETVTAVDGDGQTIAFAIERHERELRGTSEIAVVSGRFRAVDIASRKGSPEQLAVDRGRVAVLWDDGVLEVRGVAGRVSRSLRIGAARALDLTGDRLLVLRDGRVDAYSVRRHERVGTWRVPAELTRLDAHYRIAILSSAHEVYGLDLNTGRSAVVGRASGVIVDAQIEAAGVAFAYNDDRRGVARFVPMATVMRALRR